MNVTTRPLVAVVLAVALAGGVYVWDSEREKDLLRQQARAAALRTDSIEAAGDTTRMLMVSALEDHVAYYTRRMIQTAAERDSLDRELGQETRGRAELAAVVDELRDTIAGDTILVEEGVRVARFNVRQEPYTVEATAWVPPPAYKPTLALGIQLDTAQIGVRVACVPAVPVNKAVTGITTPEWLPVTVTGAFLDPSVCNPPPHEPGWWERNDQWVLGGVALVLGLWLRG